MSKLSLNKVSLKIAGQVILQDISLSVEPGELVVLLGANGAGKSSLLRSALGLEQRATGKITLSHHLVQSLTSIARAKLAAYLPQQRPLIWPIRVSDIVSLGRYAYGVSFGQLTDKDNQAVRAALTACDLDYLANRRMDTLSGGERARVHCARAFAATTDLLLADEPTSALDPKHQLRVMQLIRSYVDQGHGALIVMHEINLAARFADRLLWLKDGYLLADGLVSTTLTESMMAAVYGVQTRIDSVASYPSVTVMDVAG